MIVKQQDSRLRNRGLLLLAVILPLSFFPGKAEIPNAEGLASYTAQGSSIKQPLVLEKLSIETGVKPFSQFSVAVIPEVGQAGRSILCKKNCPGLFISHYLRNPFYVIRRSNAP